MSLPVIQDSRFKSLHTDPVSARPTIAETTGITIRLRLQGEHEFLPIEPTLSDSTLNCSALQEVQSQDPKEQQSILASRLYLMIHASVVRILVVVVSKELCPCLPSYLLERVRFSLDSLLLRVFAHVYAFFRTINSRCDSLRDKD